MHKSRQEDSYTQARDYLMSGLEHKANVEVLKSRIIMMRSQCEKCTSLVTGMPRGGGDGGGDTLLVSLADEMVRLGEEIEAEIAAFKELEVFINHIPDLLERLILRFRYLCGFQWAEVTAKIRAAGFDYSDRQLHRIHLVALDHATELYTPEEGVKD